MELDRFWLDWQPKRRETPRLVAESTAPIETAIAPLATDPLLALDADARRQVQTFEAVLGARVVAVLPRGGVDAALVGSLSWDAWRRRRLQQIFASCRMTAEQASKRAHELESERKAFLELWRRVAHGWLKWVRWRAAAPADAERFRMEHEDGRVDWLLESAARRTPLGGRAARKNESKGVDYERSSR